MPDKASLLHALQYIG